MTLNLRTCNRYCKHVAIFTAIALGGSQCAGTADGRLTQAQGTAIATTAGALIGGAIAGRDGALIGAAIGGLSGFAYGTHIANKKAQYKSTEEWLDACIAQAESKRKAAVAYNSRLNNELARLQKEVRMAKAAGDRARLAALNSQIAAERNSAQKEVENFRKEAEMARSAIQQAGGQGASRLKSLRSSTSGIETQVSTMNRNVVRLAALQSQTDV